MNKKYIVRLTADERKELEGIVKKGNGPAYRIKHAHILLNTDADGPNIGDENVAKRFCCHKNTVVNVRKRFVEQNLESALERKKRETPPVEKILDGKKEAQLIALACGKAPNGRSGWTLRLLADKLVELEVVESISYRTVGRTLKKTN